MKRIFWIGILLILSCLVIVWLGWQIISKLNNIWSRFYYLLIPWELPRLANAILLSVFSLICTGIFVLLVGFLFSRRSIKGKTLSDILLKWFSQIPGIKSIVRLISQIVEAGESIHKKQNKIAIYKTPSGKQILGMIKLKEIDLESLDELETEQVVSFYEAFTPYIFSGRPYLVNLSRVYEITNLSFQDFLKYIATGGLFFKLPKKLVLKKLKTNKRR